MAYRATYRRGTYLSGGRTRRTPPAPGLRRERELWDGGAECVCGIDEAGMGAWAGPLAVAAVCLDPAKRLYKIRDSKLLDPPRREWLAGRVRERALAAAVGLASASEIDSLGLTKARKLAAGRAIEGLGLVPDCYLVDGDLDFVGRDNVEMRVRGDSESVSIAAASLVAKTARDKLMRAISPVFEPFEFESNKGYPSPRHRWALAALGPTPVHRRLFEPVRAATAGGMSQRLLTG